MGAEATRLEGALQRDRALVFAGMGGVTLAAWAYLFHHGGATGQEMDPGMAIPLAAAAWGPVDLALLLFMWAVMMVAMMAPAVAPFILLFTRIGRRRGRDRVVGTAGTLLLGYLLAWTGFSVVVSAAQWGLHAAALLSPMMVSASPMLGGALLVSAGIFQLTPLKRACLSHCRSPVGFLMSEWRDGRWGAFVMGWKHGAYCVGCCWLLMALLFVAGVMNLIWVAVLALFVLVERVAPRGEMIGRGAGVVLITAGVVLIVG